MPTQQIVASPLLEEPKEEWKVPTYTDSEKLYLSNLQKRLERAKNLREQPHPEFDDMTYTQYWRWNEDLGNTRIRPKLNKQDVQFQSGTLRTKLFSFLSSLTGLNLSPEITAFNEYDIPINNLGVALEDIIDKTEELDNDEEKKVLRQYELLKQGDVFTEEIWEDKWITEKEPIENYNGKFRDVKINPKRVKKVGLPTRNIISGLSVYLGDLTKYFIENQPYVFTATTIHYDEAESMYKEFEMWKYVSRTIKPFSGDTDKAMTENAWRLMDSSADKVEVIRYQSKPDREYQIILNGVPMLPLGFPFPWGYDSYNITQQHFKPIRHNFAYAKSFISENKNPALLLDELMKLALLKTQKSFLPPYLNLSGRVISSKILMPGVMTMGIKPEQLVPVSQKEVEGVTNAEFAMIQEVIRTIDQQTASQTFSGSPEKGQVLATQIVELQRQSRIMLGLTILSASLMEKKLATLRLMNVLKNWFDPIDDTVDQARNVLKNKYRIISRQRNIEGEGAGMRLIMPTEELPTSEQVMAQETQMKTAVGMPVRIIALNVRELEQAKFTWVVTINPREKRSSEASKLMFRAEMEDAGALGLPISETYKQDRFAEVWGENPAKLFEKGPANPLQPPTGTQPSQGATPTLKRPQVKIPTQAPAPEAALV